MKERIYSKYKILCDPKFTQVKLFSLQTHHFPNQGKTKCFRWVQLAYACTNNIKPCRDVVREKKYLQNVDNMFMSMKTPILRIMSLFVC